MHALVQEGKGHIAKLACKRLQPLQPNDSLPVVMHADGRTSPLLFIHTQLPRDIPNQGELELLTGLYTPTLKPASGFASTRPSPTPLTPGGHTPVGSISGGRVLTFSPMEGSGVGAAAAALTAAAAAAISACTPAAVTAPTCAATALLLLLPSTTAVVLVAGGEGDGDEVVEGACRRGDLVHDPGQAMAAYTIMASWTLFAAGYKRSGTKRAGARAGGEVTGCGGQGVWG